MMGFEEITVEIKSEGMTVPDSHDNSNAVFDTLNFCQTCLASGRNNHLKDMTQTHSYGSKYEVYSDMLDYCFGQEFVNMKRLENIYLICEDCIEKLRYVVNFKEQVEVAQKKMKPKVELPSFSPASYTELQECLNKELDGIDQEILTLLSNDSLTCFSDESYDESPEINPSVTDVPNDKSFKVTRNITNRLSAKKTPVQDIKYGKTNKLHRKLLPYTLEPDEVQCKICNKVCDTPTNLQLHMPIHFPNYICDICGNVSASGYQFDMHMETHTSKFVCNLCQRTYRRLEYLQIHMKEKHGTTECLRLKCPVCGERFNSSHRRRRHLEIVHGAEPRKFKCKICEEVLDTSGKRAKHIRKFHMTERKHVCNICHAAYRERPTLREHMLKHSIKKHSCSVCMKKFARIFTLKEHMKIHTGEKKYSCDICQKAFTQKCSLIGHLAMHEKLKRSGKE